jgi:hypothetical protein
VSFFLIDLRDFPYSHQNDGNPGHRSAVTCPHRCCNRFGRDDLRLVYVPRHLHKIEKNIVADNPVPSELGVRDNMVLMVCLIPARRHRALAASGHQNLSDSASAPAPVMSRS